MALKTKTFKTLNEQVHILKSKGLVIKDENKAKEILLRENYFFISGYRHLFLEKEDKYKKGTSFEEVYALFLFDRNIRNIIFKNLLIIENNLKSIMSYCLSKKYGYREIEFFKLKTFDNKPNKSRQILDLINKIKRQIRINGVQHSATRHYMYNYGYIPLWILVKVLSLGIVSEMFIVLKPEDRMEVARYFNVSPEDLSIYLPIIANYRNLCAHEDILFENRTQRSIPDNIIHQKLEIKQIDNEYLRGKNDLFSLFIVLKQLLIENEFKKMIKEFEDQINILSEELKVIDIYQVYDRMGFPNNWYEIKNMILEEDNE